MKTVVGMFDDLAEAHRAVDELSNLGISRNDISVITRNKNPDDASDAGEHHKTHAGAGAGIGAATGALAGGILASLGLMAIPGIGWLAASGTLAATLAGVGIGAAAGGLIGALVGMGIPEEDAEEYEEGVRRGGTVVTAKVSDTHLQAAQGILERHHAVNMDQRAEQWRAAGWQPKHVRPAAAGVAPAATPPARTPPRQPVAPTRRADETQRIPVVEERLNVSKRPVSRGTVRVYSHLSEHPVSQDVRLREERVQVERRPADRPATEADLQTFKEGAVELHETAEEPVVNKDARVTGEVVVRKEAQEHTQTVKDTVRRTDVKVDRSGTRETAGHKSDPSQSGPACNT